MTYLPQAKKTAKILYDALKPHCKIIDVAGSVRRGKLEVKDIEICCIPKTVTINNANLFEQLLPEIKVHPDFIKVVSHLGKAIRGNAEGKMMSIETIYKINLDLFMPDDFDYYRQLAIRTGSAEYSHRVIANGWRKMGWCGSDAGLRMTNDCTFIPDAKDPSKGKWICTNKNAHKPPVWKSEREFFEWLNVKYLEPGKRYV